jgi:hypothetical protein
MSTTFWLKFFQFEFVGPKCLFSKSNKVNTKGMDVLAAAATTNNYISI